VIFISSARKALSNRKKRKAEKCKAIACGAHNYYSPLKW
jgi:hypothetical protein